ncbi:hypothetical protein BpHYR1_029764 [Brachionus plicatilis]|uniref:Uncharacterized protein n=1 Tax=Brachionus plicatilis TaxID=10195 RepID=A0A3M7RKF7_BRAPC|nr:hypothetical protein BpHYR1_029764 [Brachionus plicatilis]
MVNISTLLYKHGLGELMTKVNSPTHSPIIIPKLSISVQTFKSIAFALNLFFTESKNSTSSNFAIKLTQFIEFFALFTTGCV